MTECPTSGRGSCGASGCRTNRLRIGGTSKCEILKCGMSKCQTSRCGSRLAKSSQIFRLNLFGCLHWSVAFLWRLALLHCDNVTTRGATKRPHSKVDDRNSHRI
jgi:hypothetical protein